jgi:rare lipoprotein A
VRPSFPLRRLRMVHMTIALVMLAAPASALALSTTTSAADARQKPGILPMTVSPREVRLGHRVLVRGRVHATAAAATVELESAPRRRGRWQRLGATRIGPHGGWALHARLRRSAVVRAVEVAGPSRRASGVRRVDTAEALAADTAPTQRTTAVSRVTAVAVQAQMHVAVRDRALVTGADADVTGVLLPARGGRLVALQVHAGRGWLTLGHTRTGARGAFAVRGRAPAGSGRAVRVVFAGDRLNARATGGAGTLTQYVPVVVSWYDDAGSTACGFHAGDGVASRTLPCGTRVHFLRGGRSVTATVDDRGPYVGGREFDLNQNTAGALGFAGVGIVDASIG